MLDAGSARSSVAVADGGRLLGAVEFDRRSGDGDLLSAVSRVLGQAGLGRSDLRGVVTLRGPGSFTGLRIAGSTALGLSRGLDIPAGSIPTFDALALAAPAEVARPLAAVDAMRGEWHVQAFERRGADWPRPLASPALVAAGSVPAWPVDAVSGFGAERAWPADVGRARGVEPPPLTPEVAVHLSRGAGPAWWDETVTRPLYLRAPAVTLPRPR